MTQVHKIDATTGDRVSDKKRHETDGIIGGIATRSTVKYSAYDAAGKPREITATVAIIRTENGKEVEAHAVKIVATRSDEMIPFPTCTPEYVKDGFCAFVDAGKVGNTENHDYFWTTDAEIDLPVFAGGGSYGVKTYKGATTDVAAGRIFTDGGTRSIVDGKNKIRRTASIMGHISGIIGQYLENVTGMYEPARTASVPSVSRRARLDALAATIAKCLAAKNDPRFRTQPKDVRVKIDNTLKAALAEQSAIMGNEAADDPFADFA